nr:MAG TPA: hypothetical protein [Caudoviricetes sp.]
MQTLMFHKSSISASHCRSSNFAYCPEPAECPTHGLKSRRSTIFYLWFPFDVV